MDTNGPELSVHCDEDGCVAEAGINKLSVVYM